MEPADLLNGLSQTMDAGVYVDPLLVNTLSPETYAQAHAAAQVATDALYRQYGRLEDFSELSDVPYSMQLARLSILETILSTAMVLAQEETGDVQLNAGVVASAQRNVRRFLEQRGIAPLYLTYYLIVGHDILQPFVLVKEMSQGDYYRAVRHYPYKAEKLDLFLILAMYRRVLRMRNKAGKRIIAISRVGTKVYGWIHRCLEQTGHLRRRVQLSHLYQFEVIRAWDDMSHMVWPEMDEIRRSYLRWAQIPVAANVLELGCGTASLTLDAGLFERVCQGQVTAVDTSSEMLAQARIKLAQFSYPENVRFELASAEKLPYNDDTFDECCGSFFLQFVDPETALREMSRVTKSGGHISVVQASMFDMKTPFFRDWFEPVLDISGNYTTAETWYIPTAADLANWFGAVGLVEIETSELRTPWVFDPPEVVVQHVLRGVSFIQKPLAELPWDDRNTLIAELVDRGRDVCRKYAVAERTIEIPAVMVRGKRI